MLGLFKSLLGRADSGAGSLAAVRLAVAALMVEAATLDGSFDEAERRRLLDLLAKRFDLSPVEAEQVLVEAKTAQEQAVALEGMTRTIKNALDHDQRVEVLEMLWEVVYADGRLHDYEANLLRRLAGLVYVSDQEAGAARKRALARMGLQDGIA
ncbi:MAG TPA: TerB family tellurite resistance protein [Magnetospirillum sp.]|nr:TerB family tellurite resistance protein [Magnetospirillum sp.]